MSKRWSQKCHEACIDHTNCFDYHLWLSQLSKWRWREFCVSQIFLHWQWHLAALVAKLYYKIWHFLVIKLFYSVPKHLFSSIYLTVYQSTYPSFSMPMSHIKKLLQKTVSKINITTKLLKLNKLFPVQAEQKTKTQRLIHKFAAQGDDDER